METKNTLIQLYNTLSLISVKGEDVKTMAACLQCVEQLVQQCDTPPAEQGNTEEKAAV